MVPLFVLLATLLSSWLMVLVLLVVANSVQPVLNVALPSVLNVLLDTIILITINVCLALAIA